MEIIGDNDLFEGYNLVIQNLIKKIPRRLGGGTRGMSKGMKQRVEQILSEIHEIRFRMQMMDSERYNSYYQIKG